MFREIRLVFVAAVLTLTTMPLETTVRIRTGERDDHALTAVNADQVMRMTQAEMPVPRPEDYR